MFLVKPAYAAAWDTAFCTGSAKIDNPAYDVATIRGIQCLIANLLTPIPTLLALVAVGVIIMAGIRLITAGADPKAYAAAWQQLTWAVVGLILLAEVWLVLVAIEKFTGAPVTKLGFPD